MGGIQFLVQDSLPGRPFVGIGIDLLQSMGVKNLVGIEAGVVFHGTTNDNSLDEIPIRLTSDEKAPKEKLSHGMTLDYIGFEGLDENANFDNFVVRT
jgi:hypothetical protein